METAAKDIGLTNPGADSQGFELPCLELRPVIEGRAGFAKRAFGAVARQLLEDDILVAAPLVGETIFVFLDFS